MNLTRKLLFIIIFLLLSFEAAQTQFAPPGNEKNFYFDVVVFKGKADTVGRVDFYSLVPYQYLTFTLKNGVYQAVYDIVFTLTDSVSGRTQSFSREKVVTAADYFVSQGGTGAADFTQKVFYAHEGNYTAKASIIERGSSSDVFRTRGINVIDFNKFPFSLSGILLLSSIEEKDGKFKITPQVSENVADLENGYFAFFEIYNKSGVTEADFVYEIRTMSPDKLLLKGERVRKKVKPETSQEFIRVQNHKELRTGKYYLRVIALKAGADEDYTESDYLAVSQHTIDITQTIEGAVLNDIALAIRQLQYAASSSEMDYITAGADSLEKTQRFFEFWDSRDPFLNTKENEAMIDYYKRVDLANRLFGTYSEGWLSDRGMVYIIYGAPDNIERVRNYNDGRLYERWIYNNNNEFIFIDNTGFGDFRLIRPYSVSDKYRYGR